MKSVSLVMIHAAYYILLYITHITYIFFMIYTTLLYKTYGSITVNKVAPYIVTKVTSINFNYTWARGYSHAESKVFNVRIIIIIIVINSKKYF